MSSVALLLLSLVALSLVASFVDLSSASGAAIGDNQAVGTIIDDESGGAGIPDPHSDSRGIDQFAPELAAWWIEFESERLESVITGRKTRR